MMHKSTRVRKRKSMITIQHERLEIKISTANGERSFCFGIPFIHDDNPLGNVSGIYVKHD